MLVTRNTTISNAKVWKYADMSPIIYLIGSGYAPAGSYN
jgi:hypothetical protein